MAIDIKELDREIAETKQYLADLEATRRVIAKRAGTKYSLPDEPILPRLEETGTIHLDDLVIPKRVTRKKSTLTDDIRGIIERFGNQEFTVTHVEAALKQSGKATDAKHFKNRVSVIIRKLTEDGVIKRTHVGKGNDPHHYQLKSPRVSLVKSGD